MSRIHVFNKGIRLLAFRDFSVTNTFDGDDDDDGADDDQELMVMIMVIKN